MDLYRKQQQYYADTPSDQLLQEVMKTFEDIPSKVQQYPQMRRDIKSFLESQSDKSIRILFELSKRMKCLEAAASGTSIHTVASSSNKEEKLLGKLQEVENTLTSRLSQMEVNLKHEISELNIGNDDRGADILEHMFKNFEETKAEIVKSTEGVVGRTQALFEDLAGTVARDVVEAKTQISQITKGLTAESNMVPQTYASAAATKPGRRPALHSMAVTFEDNQETAEEVLARVRKAVDARGTGLKINKIRKAKNSTVILGCDTEVELDKVRERIKSHGDGLIVAPMKNKDPLVVLKDVFMDNDDNEMVKALYAQNADIFMGLSQEEMDLTIKFKKRTRNPKTSHVVIQVRPKVWQRMTEAGALYLDLQRVRVEDQSPLIQCTKCLAFGHGRKLCTESVDKCSHCGGPHLREKCADYAAGIEPQCCNCLHSKLRSTDHNAFSVECPTRKKWDYLARSNTAYI